MKVLHAVDRKQANSDDPHTVCSRRTAGDGPHLSFGHPTRTLRWSGINTFLKTYRGDEGDVCSACVRALPKRGRR